MKPSIYKVLTIAVLPVVIALLAFFCIKSVMAPIKFNKEKEAREQVAIQRLKDIRTLQTSFKSKFGHYSPSADSLIWFYREGKIDVIMQVGSKDDSLAVANTEKVKKEFKKDRKNKGKDISPEQLLALYEQGQKLVFEIKHEIPVKDTLCKRPGFVVEDIKWIPFSAGVGPNDKKVSVQFQAVIKSVSGVNVPLFEATMPYKCLLEGLDHQQVVNLIAERADTDRYPGLKVGSVDSPNNNAGNWE